MSLNRLRSSYRPEHPESQQSADSRRVVDRRPNHDLHLPEVMDGRADAAYIDEAMEDLPLAAEPADPALGRGDCEGSHEDKGGESHRDERALYDVLHDQAPGEELI